MPGQRELVQAQRQRLLEHALADPRRLRSGGRWRAKKSRLRTIFAMRSPCDTISSTGRRMVRRHLAREQQLAVADDDAERVVQLVGDAGDELAERRHLGRLHELGLGVAQAREAVAARSRRGARSRGRARPGRRRPAAPAARRRVNSRPVRSPTARAPMMRSWVRSGMPTTPAMP